MRAASQSIFGDDAIKHPAATCFGNSTILIVKDMPVWIGHKERLHVCRIAQIEKLILARRDMIDAVSGRMAESRNDPHARHHFFFSRHQRAHRLPFGEEAVNAPNVTVTTLGLFLEDVRLRPIIELSFRHDNLCIGENTLVSLAHHHAVNVIGMKMREKHTINLLGCYARELEAL